MSKNGIRLGFIYNNIPVEVDYPDIGMLNNLKFGDADNSPEACFIKGKLKNDCNTGATAKEKRYSIEFTASEINALKTMLENCYDDIPCTIGQIWLTWMIKRFNDTLEKI